MSELAKCEECESDKATKLIKVTWDRLGTYCARCGRVLEVKNPPQEMSEKTDPFPEDLL